MADFSSIELHFAVPARADYYSFVWMWCNGIFILSMCYIIAAAVFAVKETKNILFACCLIATYTQTKRSILSPMVYVLSQAKTARSVFAVCPRRHAYFSLQERPFQLPKLLVSHLLKWFCCLITICIPKDKRNNERLGRKYQWAIHLKTKQITLKNNRF